MAVTKEARQCGGKHRHPNRVAAIGHLLSLRSQGAWTRNMAAYRCKFCKAWHVGHKPRGKR